jgi:hypothetical protein
MIYEAIVNGQVLWRVYWKRELAATFLSQEEAKEYLMLLEFVEQLPTFNKREISDKSNIASKSVK